jgi:hypothetical protein
MHYWKGIRYADRQNLILQSITKTKAKSLIKRVLAHRLLKGVSRDKISILFKIIYLAIADGSKN